MKRTPLQATEAEPVRPSTRDPIAQWLDVFTSLLALPAGEADRIRDELEDHLRTRVDDLLILGLSEPEAVQKAVTELGETAQLARNFRSVRTHSRRRIAMHTALFAAAGLALTVSVAGLIPRSPSPAFAPIAAVQPEETRMKALGVDLPGGTLEATLNTVAEATGARLFVHWNALETSSGLSPETEVGAIPAKNLRGDKILQLMNSMLNLSGEGALAVRHDGDLVEVANEVYFDRIETVTREYDLTLLIPAASALDFTDEGANLRNGITMVIEPEIWEGDGGAIAIHGSMMIVRAPERVQTMVASYIAKLEASQRERDEQDAKDDEAARREQLNVQTRSLAQMQSYLSTVESELANAIEELDAVNVEYWKNEYQRPALETAHNLAEGDEARARTLDALANAGSRLESLKMRRDVLLSVIAERRKSVENIQNHLASLRPTVEALESAGR